MLPLTKDELTKLLIDVSNGHELAFRKLFEVYYPNIYTTALRITKNEYVAEDIVQDTFLKVWINRESINRYENFEGWLYTVSKNITYNILKKGDHYKKYIQQEGKESLLSIYPSADYEMQDKDFQALLQQAVDRLPPKQRQTYALLKEQFLKRNEAAEILNVSPETVKWNIDQAMRSIRAYCLSHINGMPLVLLLHFFSKYF